MSRVLSWRQILASLTTNPARRFAHDGGTMVPGAAAAGLTPAHHRSVTRMA